MNTKTWCGKIFSLTLVLSTCLLLFRPSHAESESAAAEECFSTSWPSEQSTLQPDPSLVRGRLANGLRYVLKKNSEPKNRVAIYLDVQAGSLHEQDNQRGVAHFLEHMMFKGTVNFPGDSLIDYFQSIGMNFGGDINALTNYEQTQYHLILPNGSEPELDKGLLVVADYAGRATLDETQIDKERGVILAEKRARDSAAYRIYLERTAFALQGTLLPERIPIGEEQILRQADRDLLTSYYEAWYRPEKMILVVVGDLDLQLTKTLIDKHFSPLSAKTGRPACPEYGRLTPRNTATFYRYEPEFGKTNVSIDIYWDKERQNDSPHLQRQELTRLLGTMIMNYRLQRLQEQENSPVTHAGYAASDIIDRIGFASISAQTNPERWQESLTLLDETLRQAAEYGFTGQELDRAKKEIRAALEARVLNAHTEDSRAIAREIIANLNSNRVYQSPQQEMAFYGPLLEQLGREEVNNEFRQDWQRPDKIVSLVGDTNLGEGAETRIGDAYRQSQKKAVAAFSADESRTFPYLTPAKAPSEAPTIAAYPDIGVEKLVFANGLVVNLKKTDFQENRVQVVAHFGSGKQSEPRPGMAMLTEEIINSSGTGRMPQSELEALVAGSSVEWRFRIGESAFSWIGGALFKDFDLSVQVLHSLMYDQGFREDQYGNVRARILHLYQKASREIDGAMALDIQPFLADHNPHFGLPPLSEVSTIEFARLREYAASFAWPGDLEISVVGDFDRDKVVSTLARYFAGAPLAPPQISEAPAVHFPEGRKKQVQVATSIDKSLVVVAWPTSGRWEITRNRRLQVLAGVLEDRLRKSIRESLGATYSPQVSSFSSRVYQGYGFILAQMVVQPGSEESIIDEVLKIGELLQRQGVGEEELVRIRKPLVTGLLDGVESNPYWLGSVLGLSSRYPEQLDWPKTIISDFSSISADQINQLARQYLRGSAAAIAKVTPTGKMSDPAQPELENTAQVERESKGDTLQPD